MTGDEDLVALLPRLRYNGAANLRRKHDNPCPLNPDSIHGKGPIFTGLGKWTTLAAIGVENHLKSLGLATEEKRGHGTGSRRDRGRTVITPLGTRMARYLSEHWGEAVPQFKDMR